MFHSMIPTLAAIRFGTGLSPNIAPPTGAADVLDRLARPDDMAGRFPVQNWQDRMIGVRLFDQYRRARRKSPEDSDLFRTQNRALANGYHEDLRTTLLRAAFAEDGFRERLTWFWAGHFAVEDSRGYLRRSVASYHEDAIRPLVAARFGDLLKSAVTHPAMVVYLDQQRSMGPNSARGQRGGGLNENLAREILELHTLGVAGGYAQTDVREFAELLTGLTVTKEGAPAFNRNFAEPGAETVLGESYGGEAPNRHDIVAVLDDLAVHPATAAHLSRKLATHFIADTPPDDMVRAMVDAWLQTGGALTAVYGAMLDHPAAWLPELRKVRRPLDMMAAAIRATGSGPQLARAGLRIVRRGLTDSLARMGQPWLRPSGPDGWPEEAEAWITPHGLAARLDWTMMLANWMEPTPDPRALVETALGPLAGPRIRFAAQAAEDRAAGVGLVLAAPEFQRR